MNQDPYHQESIIQNEKDQSLLKIITPIEEDRDPENDTRVVDQCHLRHITPKVGDQGQEIDTLNADQSHQENVILTMEGLHLPKEWVPGHQEDIPPKELDGLQKKTTQNHLGWACPT
jgi:hypothetical protein